METAESIVLDVINFVVSEVHMSQGGRVLEPYGFRLRQIIFSKWETLEFIKSTEGIVVDVDNLAPPAVQSLEVDSEARE